MSPRRPPDEEPEGFEAEFDDDVFAAPEPAPAPKRKRSSKRSLSRTTGAPRSTAPRGRRALRIAGVVALVLVLLSFVLSFIAGLGGNADERVVGDAEQAGAELDRIGPRVRVEVLNAGGVAGTARRATEHLRDRGFDVVYMGNAGDFAQDSTVVIARTTDVDAAQRVARALGTDSVVAEPDPQLFVDATVRLGKDWPPAQVAAADDPGFFGRVRGWFAPE